MVAGLPAAENVKVVYSSALADVDISDPALYSQDAWHPRGLGHDVLAEAVYKSMASNSWLHYFDQ